MAETQEVTEFNRLLGQRIRELIPVQTVWAVAKAIDWDNKTMVATGQTDELDYEDVSLGLGWERKKPKVGTMCLLGIEENNGANAFLIDAAEVEEIVMALGNATLTVKPEGFLIKNGSENLKTVLNDMITEINKIIVINGTSINVAAMLAIKQRLNSILIE